MDQNRKELLQIYCALLSNPSVRTSLIQTSMETQRSFEELVFTSAHNYYKQFDKRAKDLFDPDSGV